MTEEEKMSKIKVELELDYIDDENNLDGAIIERITREIASRISKKSIDKAVESVGGLVDEQVDKAVADCYTKLMDHHVVITDKWGDKEEEHKSVEDMIKLRFDKYLSEKVNAKGQVAEYSTIGTRLSFLIDERIRKHSEKFMVEAVEKVNTQMKNQMDESLKKALGERLSALINIDSLLAKK